MIQKKYKLLFVISSLDTGGAQKMLSNLLVNLGEEYEVELLLNSDNNIEYDYVGKIITLNVKEPKDRNELGYQLEVLFKRLRMLKKLKKSKGYDACISFMDSGNIANILTKYSKTKTIITGVTMISPIMNSPRYKYIILPLAKYMYNKADSIVVCSEGIRKDIMKLMPRIKSDKIKTIYNGINNNNIKKMYSNQELTADAMWFDSEKTVITAGRLTYQKGHWHLIRAFKKVVEADTKAKLVIFGEGELESYLRTMINKLSLENNVIIKKFDSNLDFYIKKSAIFCLPSMYEGMSTAMLEALSCGTTCIATNHESGPVEVLAPNYEGTIEGSYFGEYGILTPLCSEKMNEALEPLEKEEQCMADAIIEVIGNKQIRNNYSNQGMVRSQDFDMINIAEKWKKTIGV